MLLGFDIDDIVFQTFNGIHKYTKDYLNIELPIPKNFTVLEENLEKNQIKFVLDNVLNNYNYIKPNHDCLSFIKDYYKKFQKEILFITSRSEHLSDGTFEMVASHLENIPFKIFFSQEKEKEIKSLKIDFFIEDRFKTAWNVAESGIIVFLKIHSWNRGRKDHPYIIPFSKWTEIRNRLGF